MTLRHLIALSLTLAACNGGGGDEDELDLSGTTGDIDGSLAYGDDETITFGSAIAFGDSFFEDGRDVVMFAEWDNASCESTDSFDWEGSGEGYKLVVPHDGVDGSGEATLWDCAPIETGNGTGQACGGIEYPIVSITFDQYDNTRGGTVTGTAVVGETTDAFLAGTLNFEVTFCGDE